jgi:predicted Zn finger-like uncharacterized protein
VPIVTRCPSCNKSLRVPDKLLGSKVRCPSCKNTFTAEEPDDAAERPAAPAPKAGPVTDRPAKAPKRPPAPEPEPDEEQFEETDDQEPEEQEEPQRRRPSRSKEAALSMVSAPAIALIVVGVLDMISAVMYLLFSLVGGGLQMLQPAGPPGMNAGAMNAGGALAGTAVNVVSCLVAAAIGAVVLYGGLQMKSLKSRGWAMAASIITVIPCLTCCLWGLPIGIWSLMTLNKDEVKRAFG